MSWIHPSELTAHIDARQVAVFVAFIGVVIGIALWRAMKEDEGDDK